MLYRLNERDWEGMRYVFCDRAEMERVCEKEEIEDRECEEIEVSDDVVQLLKETAHEILNMGEGSQEVFDGVASAYINRGRELVNFIEYLRETEFDDLAERWESFKEYPSIKEWTRKKIADVEILSVRKLSAYEKGKANARYLAGEYQYESTEWHMTYGDLCEWGDYFRKLGKRYGLSEEFRENGII